MIELVSVHRSSSTLRKQCSGKGLGSVMGDYSGPDTFALRKAVLSNLTLHLHLHGTPYATFATFDENLRLSRDTHFKRKETLQFHTKGL